MQEVTLYVPDGARISREGSLGERQLLETTEFLQERIAALEFALEDEGWQLQGDFTEREFSRQGLQKIIKRSRLMYLSNPMVRRPVDVQANYVFGQGVEFEAEDPDVNDVVQAFLDDPANRAELTAHQALTLKEVDLQVEGNIFFVYFTDPVSGAVQVRSLPVDEVDDIICNPDDGKEPWFYRRAWTERQPSGSTAQREAFYPDYRYAQRRKNPVLGGIPIFWDTPVHHVKVGGLSSMRFGVPPTYPALDWAKAYKESLEDDATRSRALTRFAMKLTVQGTAAALAPAKQRMETTYGRSPTAVETNPPPVTGATFIGRKDAKGGMLADIEPVKLDGTLLPPDHSRPFRLMVCAAMGLPETYFGDTDVGNYATAKTMDRPTELMMAQRRSIWADVFRDMFDYVVRKAINTPGGRLRPKYRIAGDGKVEPKRAMGVTTTVNVNWPSILERDIGAQIAAIVQAATLGGQPPQPVLGMQTVTRKILSLLGTSDIDEKITQWFGDAPDALPAPPAPPALVAPGTVAESDIELRMRGLLAEALREAMAEA